MSEVEDLLERIERRAEALVRENARLRDKIVDLDRKGEEMQKAIKDKSGLGSEYKVSSVPEGFRERRSAVAEKSRSRISASHKSRYRS